MLDALQFDAEERPRLVHRLDRDTSGCLVLARSQAAARKLTAAFKDKTARKIYWAVTVGAPKMNEGKIDAPGSRAKSKTVGKLDPRPGGSKQKCFHGSPATCKSVKWIAVYTALREKRGMTKSKAAAIANAMHNRWKTGRVGPRNHHPIIRKTI